MEMVVLIIHLLVCICLIGLVLLQRSEGGALGMGGGGGGALMSGRGAADALAKMTSVAGGFFLVTSLGLTVLSNAGATSQGGSVFDNFVPSQSAPVTPAPVAPAPAAPETPDPTESSIAPETQLASAIIPATVQPASTTRAAPLGPGAAAAATPTQRPPAPATTRTATPPRTAGSAPSATTVPVSTAPRTTTAPAPNRTATGTTPAATAPERPLVLPNTSGSGVSGIALSDDPASQPESIEIGNGVEAVRRERAGPDQ